MTDFTDLRLLGAGATARVYEARGPSGPVLLKIGARAHEATLRREAVTLFLARGPDTLGLLDVASLEVSERGAARSPGGQPALVLEPRRGETLRALFDRGASIDAEAVARDLARSLAQLHQAKLAHGDVKPDNVALDARGAFLLDFGLAQPASSPAPRGATLRYLPRGPALGTAASRDLFALGLTLYETVRPDARGARDLEAAAREGGLVGPLADLVFGLLLEDPSARPRARWVASFLGGSEDSGVAAARRRAHVRTTYLSLFPALFLRPPRTALDGEPHVWLSEAVDFAGLLGRTFGASDASGDAAVVGVTEKSSLDRADRRELLARLFGVRASRVETTLVDGVSERALLDALVSLADGGPLDAVQPAQLRAALRDGRTDAGTTSLAVEASPTRLAVALCEAPTPDWAIDAVEASRVDDPTLVAAAARALRLRGETGRAFVLLRRGLAASPDHPTLLAGGAELARRVGDAALAQDLLRRLSELTGPGEIARRIRATRARLAFDSGDPDAAIRLVDPPEIAPEYEVLALAHAARGELGRAIAVLRDSADVPTEPEERARLWGALGYVLAAESPREAQRAFARAAEHATNVGALVEEATYLTGLGAASSSLGLVEAALTASERAWLLWESIGWADRATRALLNLGATHRLAGNLDVARSFAAKAQLHAGRASDRTAELYALFVRVDTDDDEAVNALRAVDLCALPAQDQLLAAARLLHHAHEASVPDVSRLDEIAREPSTPHAARAEWLTARLVTLAAAEARGADAAGTPRRDEAEGKKLAARLIDTPGDCPVAALGPALFHATRYAEAHGLVDVGAKGRRRLAELAETMLANAGELRDTVARVDWVSDRTSDARIFSNAAPEQAVRLEQLVRSLSNEATLRDLLRGVLDALVVWTRAERGVLLLRAPDGRLVPRAARNLHASDLTDDHLAVSTTLAKRALDSAAPVLATDAMTELPDLHASVHALNLRSVLVVPLIAWGEAIGVAYLDDRIRRGAFGQTELDWAKTVASLAAAIVSRALNEARLRRLARKEASLRKAREAELERSMDRVGELERAMSDRRSKDPDHPFAALVGESPALTATLAIAARAARADVPVLLLGESGTGKELLARAVHAASKRRERPFVSENVAAIPDTLLESALFGHARGAFTGADRPRIGLFEAADGGTLFLDEVGEMSLAMQTKLLRVLEDGNVRALGSERVRKVDVRIVAATHRDLEDLVRAKAFREDLFYRLAVLPIRLPPLRERPSDIAPLVRSFVERHKTVPAVTVTADALAYLELQPFPGNVRQLENVVRRALILEPSRIELANVAGAPTAASLPRGEVTTQVAVGQLAGKTLREHLDDLERALVTSAMESTRGNQTQAAKALGVSRFGLAKMLKRLGLGDLVSQGDPEPKER